MYVRKNLLSMFSTGKVHFHNLNMVPPSGCGRCQPTKGGAWNQDPRKYHRSGGKEKCFADQQRNPGGICTAPFLLPLDIDFLDQIASTYLILQAAEKNKADIEKYKLQQQAEANEALYSDK